MNVELEQLKVIMETIGSTTDGVTTFAYWWLAKSFIFEALAYGIGVFVLYAIYTLFFGMAVKVEQEEARKAKNKKERQNE